jgi:hypothetical protein
VGQKEEVTARLQALLPSALDVLEAEMSVGNEPSRRLKAAEVILRLSFEARRAGVTADAAHAARSILD